MAVSWRDILGVKPAIAPVYTHNSHNAQKAGERGNSAHFADSAHRESEETSSKLMEVLAEGCRGLNITPSEVKGELAPEDINDWLGGSVSDKTLAAFARSVAQRREMDQGKRPSQYTEQARCRRCGPVWLWFSGDVLGCPWCWNRVSGKPIPRPISIQCGECSHFIRTEQPHLGHCAKGEPEAIAGIWDTDQRYCERFLPRLEKSR